MVEVDVFLQSKVITVFMEIPDKSNVNMDNQAPDIIFVFGRRTD